MTTNEETPNNESSEHEAGLEEGLAGARETLAEMTTEAETRGARDTVAEAGAAAAGVGAATGRARETVMGTGAEAITPQPETTDTKTPSEGGDAPVPRMPDGLTAKRPESTTDETAIDEVVGDAPDDDLSQTPALDRHADIDADVDLDANVDLDTSADLDADVDLDGRSDAEPSSSEPPVGRYGTSRNHRVAADTKGRTLSESEFKSLSRRSLLTGVVGAAAGFLGWRTIQNRPADDRIPDVLRDVHQANESIWRGLFREGAEAPTFDYSESSLMRINGRHGIREELDMESWELVVVGRDGERLGTHSLEDLREMEQIEMTVEHKCVEGWAHIVTWGGVPFSDFVDRFYPEEAAARFVGLATPDNEYRVGLDMDSMLHSQTMLTLDLQREPLSDQHGAPVRLTTPLKYGIKQIKRIGTIEFSDTQPEGDYWATRGYDWYAGL